MGIWNKTQLNDEKKKNKIWLYWYLVVMKYIILFKVFIIINYDLFNNRIFVLVFLVTLLYLINLIQKKCGYSVNEKTSQYFIYLFVGIIGVFFIYLLIRMNVPSFSLSFSNKYLMMLKEIKIVILI